METKDIIKKRRVELGLTMKEVADAVGVSEATVSRWESGDIANMKRDRIEALAIALDVSPMLILGRPDKIAVKSAQKARLLKYAELFSRLQDLPEKEQAKAAKMIDTILTTFEE